MAKRKSKVLVAQRKRRTRQHIIEELSVHYIKGLVLRCGYSIEETTEDYGLDLWMQTYNENGEVEQDIVWMQVKATESLASYELKGDDCFSYSIETKDIRLWASSILPVYLVLYDASLEEAYWLNTNDMLEDIDNFHGHHKNMRIPCCNILGAKTIHMMRDYKNALSRVHQIQRKKQ